MHSNKLWFPLDAHKLECFCRAVSVIKEELFACINVPFSEYTNSVISIDHHDPSKAVGTHGVIRKADLVSFPSGVHDVVLGQVEEKAALVLVIHLGGGHFLNVDEMEVK